MKNICIVFLGLLLFVSCKETKESGTTLKSIAVSEPKEIVQKTSKSTKLPIESKPLAQQEITKDSVLTLAYNGTDLGYLASQHYGNKAFRNVLSSYNNFEDKRHIDKKHDSIKLPELSYLSRDKSLPKLHAIAEHLDKVIKARNLYLKHEKALWELPKKDPENRNFKSVPHALKLELLGASKLLFESVSGLEQNENSPKKAIGQFRQVAVNLVNIANGKIDENGYALDMVHQRLAHGLSNCIKWAKKN